MSQTRCSELPLRPAFAAASLAHVIIDMQVGYCHPVLKKEYNIHHNIAQKLAAFVRQTRAALTPFWVVHKYGDDYESAMQAPLPVRRYVCEQDLYRQSPQPEDEFIIKPKWDAFEDTDMEERLRGKGIDTVLVSGVLLEKCVASTVRGALSRGFNVCVISDLVGNLQQDGVTMRHFIERKGWQAAPSSAVLQALSEDAPAPCQSTDATRRMFVEPGVPKGTPAVMTMRWPLVASP